MDCIEGAKLLINDESVDLIIVDPPFNLRFGGTTQTKTKKPRFNIIANDNLSHREYQRFTLKWLQQAYRILKTTRHIYVFIDWRMYPLMSLWRIPRISGNKTIHPTEKPVELMNRIVTNSSEVGEQVVDFFSGSGPVSEAAITHDRDITAFEIDPLYFKMTKERIKNIFK